MILWPTFCTVAEGIAVEADEDDVRLFYVTIDGPEDTPYEGGKFKIQMYVPEAYPDKPPKCLFITPCYHVNLDNLGK